MNKEAYLNKTSLIKEMANKAGVTQAVAKSLLDAYIEINIETALNDGKVVIPGFGIFETVLRSERVGTNLRTKEKIKIPASRIFRFRVSSNLKKKAKDVSVKSK